MPHADDIVLIGPMGSGKSTVAKALAAHMNMQAIDLDADIETDAEMTIAQIFAAEGESGFRAREHAALKRALGRACVIATGGGIVLDVRNRDLISESAACVWLDAPLPVLANRLHSERAHRPLLNGVDIETKLSALDAERRPLYSALAQLHMDTREGSAEDIAVRIATALAVLQ